jgi:hypothetical protein
MAAHKYDQTLAVHLEFFSRCMDKFVSARAYHLEETWPTTILHISFISNVTVNERFRPGQSTTKHVNFSFVVLTARILRV